MNSLDRFFQARNYVVYYGAGREEQLKKFDIAIVEPTGHSRQAVQDMQSQGSLVIAYLSVVEVLPWDSIVKALQSRDFLPGFGPESNQSVNLWADLRSPTWVELLLHRAGYLLEYVGYDGLFIDTVANVENSCFPTKVRSELIEAAAGLMQRLRQRFPRGIILQNNGFAELIRLNTDSINAVCWENPRFDQQTAREWHRAVAQNLARLRQTELLQVFILFDEGTSKVNWQAAKQLAQQKDFLIYRAVHGYCCTL